MKVLFLVVGKTVDKHLIALINDYTERVKHYMPFEMEVIPELKKHQSAHPRTTKGARGRTLAKTTARGRPRGVARRRR